MNIYVEEIKGIFKNVNIKRPKFNLRLPKVDWSTITIKKPSRGLVVAIGILLELLLIFMAFWIFDDRTSFANDYLEKRTYSSLSRWGWVHKSVATIIILVMLAWLIAIFNEFASYNKKGRTFYKLYKKKDKY